MSGSMQPAALVLVVFDALQLGPSAGGTRYVRVRPAPLARSLIAVFLEVKIRAAS